MSYCSETEAQYEASMEGFKILLGKRIAEMKLIHRLAQAGLFEDSSICADCRDYEIKRIKERIKYCNEQILFFKNRLEEYVERKGGVACTT